ncbi:kinesin-like protein KIN-14I isoform X2 [Elaeis guineensis]|uniref:Kinesin-like calmodulin-binding protein n=1 Tax=Elaeis guineensis var. tenera TaxID=51953 RepID=A0A6I9RMF3_ELAGV|nr:kinesin-like protein KIN-14I isoform X1 [Elaeis guineensis]XP_029122033.1 kinesin-like protein KIN-14I isoform X1 [Elaeis guineensis]XP_029122034.1 kinesin-like protein KIN-14I isoform X1 [Elaeis guineensis]
MTVDNPPVTAQGARVSQSSLSSSNGNATPFHSSNGSAISLHGYAASENGDGYDSDGSYLAPPTPTTLSMSIPPELAGAIPLINRFQVEGFLKSMQKQMQSAGKRGFFSKKSVGLQVRERFTFEDMLCFQKDPIPTSLLKISSDLVNRSVKMFQIILKYMGIESSDKITILSLEERIELVAKLYKHTLKRSELRDELFAQISKQTRNNPDRSCLLKAWELMYLCASSMPPSKHIGAYLSEYVHHVSHGLNTDPEVQVLTLNTLNALKRSVKAGPRVTIPAREEIEALLTGKRLTTIVFFLDETFEEITYDMATTVADSVEELAGIIKLSVYSSFSLFECRKVVNGSKSPDVGNEEYIGLDDNQYIGDLLAEFKAAKDRSKGEILHYKLIFKKRLFRESDEAVADPMFVQLSYVQLQHDYILGNYPVGRDDAAQLSALQILVEIGFVDHPDTCGEWISLLERFLPRQIAMTRAKRDWEVDIISRYQLMEHMSKDDARQQFLRILRTLPYGNSVFFSVRKIDDPIGLLPGRIILGINKRGVHFFRPVPKEYLHSAELRDIMQFGSSNTAVFFKIRVAGVLQIFQFETKQGEEICVALQTHINDVMLRRYSKARSASGGATHGDFSQTVKPPSMDVYEKRVQELSRAVEESQKNADRVFEELHAKQKQELEMQEELQGLENTLQSERQKLQEVINDRDKLKALCSEKDSALQAVLVDKSSLEAMLTKLSTGGQLLVENNTKRECLSGSDYTGGDGLVMKGTRNNCSDTETLSKIQEELRQCREELHASNETSRMLLKEKSLLEQKIQLLVKKNNEKSVTEKSFEDERRKLKLHIKELEQKFESMSQALNAAESTLAMRNAERDALQNNLKELEELREFKEDIDRKNEQTAEILKKQGAQLVELEALYKEEQILRKRYYNMIEDMKGKIRVYCRLRPLNEKEIALKEKNVIISVDEFTVAHPWKDDKSKQHIYDHVFDQTVSQEEVFEDTKYLVQSAVDGYNVCIFAYGQTGSGKTFTIYGSESQPGLTARATAELFKVMKRDSSKYSFSLKVYMVELYQDNLVDLLLPKYAKRSKLDIKKDSKGMVTIENVTIVQISSFEELRTIISRGSEQRHTAETQMNDQSSRSHLILSIIIESTNLQTQSLARGKLSFVDLAGSERVKKSGSAGKQLKEAQSINKSLSALADVIGALSSDGQHIPYRNHKLTMLMSDSIGGNAKTLMFVNVSPAESNLDETYNSLMYASRVRCIVNDPSKNVSSKEVVRLKKLLAYWKEQAGKRGDDEEVEDIQDVRHLPERTDGRLST